MSILILIFKDKIIDIIKLDVKSGSLIFISNLNISCALFLFLRLETTSDHTEMFMGIFCLMQSLCIKAVRFVCC